MEDINLEEDLVGTDLYRSKEVLTPKQIYAVIQETTKKVEVSSGRCTKVEELFVSDILEKRLTIKSLCEQLLDENPVKTYGGFVREKLWKTVFYDAVVRARKIQRGNRWTEVQLAYLKTHMLDGICQFHMIAGRLQRCPEFQEIPLLTRPSTLEGVLLEDNMDIVYKSRSVTQEERERVKWLVDLWYMCLINIGDLYRYLTDIYSKAEYTEESQGFFYKAAELYTQAFLIHPNGGLSMNQLGNVYCGRNWGIDSAYYLLYSTLTRSPYEGAYPNLCQLLDRKLVDFARLPASIQPKPMEVMCHGFLSMLYHLICGGTHLPNYKKFCEDTLSNFHERLVTYDPDLDEQLLYKLSLIPVMTVWRLQMTDSKLSSHAVAFAMSVFFQLVNHLGQILEEYAHVDVNYCGHSSSSSPSPIHPEENTLPPIDENSTGNRDEKGKNKIKPKCPRIGTRRGPRHRASSIPSLQGDDEFELEDSESEISGDDDEYFSDSEGSDGSYSSNQEYRSRSQSAPICENINKAFDTSSSNGQSETSGSASNSQKERDGLQKQLVRANSNSELSGGCVTGTESPVSHDQPIERFVIDGSDLMKCMPQIAPLLVALTPYIRWLQTCTEVKDALASHAEKDFLEKLCRILTLFMSHNWAGGALQGVSPAVEIELKRDWKELGKSEEDVDKQHLFKWELPEDRSMLGLPLIQHFLCGLKIQDELTTVDELIIRMGRFVNFGNWMAETNSFSMMYAEERHSFFIPTPKMLKDHLRFLKIKRLLEGEEGSEGVVRLTKVYREVGKHEEVRQERRRERQHRGNRRHKSPVENPLIVVIDLSAALYYFENVRRISCHRKFLVYIPSSVMNTLDMLKDTEQKGSKEARVAFRWFESALNRHHPGVRILREDQKVKVDTEYPHDLADFEAMDYFDMLECCRYIIEKMLDGDSRNHSDKFFNDLRDRYRVFFLSGVKYLLDSTIKRNFDPIKAARDTEIYVDKVSLYPSGINSLNRRRKPRKWKGSFKNKG